VRETTEDLEWLQALLDRSYRQAGAHLLSIHTPERRLSATQLVERLTGVRVLTLATVTADGRPLTGAVDGLFYRGEFWFGSSPVSIRFRHLRLRPRVSATHTVGEDLAVTVHGMAHETDLEGPAHRGFRDLCLDVYGPDWDDWGTSAAYARIEAQTMFGFVLGGT
jgi:hypothetical protein